MTVRRIQFASDPIRAGNFYVVRSVVGGVYVSRVPDLNILYDCDTAEEDEQVRQAYEHHRELVERATRTLEDTLTKLGVTR